jgi:hypothetical protein
MPAAVKVKMIRESYMFKGEGCKLGTQLRSCGRIIPDFNSQSDFNFAFIADLQSLTFAEVLLEEFRSQPGTVIIDYVALQVFKKGHLLQAHLQCGQYIRLHCSPGMITEAGVDMVISAEIEAGQPEHGKISD